MLYSRLMKLSLALSLLCAPLLTVCGETEASAQVNSLVALWNAFTQKCSDVYNSENITIVTNKVKPYQGHALALVSGAAAFGLCVKLCPWIREKCGLVDVRVVNRRARELAEKIVEEELTAFAMMLQKEAEKQEQARKVTVAA